MAKFFIADEVNDSRTADVLPSGALETVPIYSYAYMTSAVGAKNIYAGACIIHSVLVGGTASANNGSFAIGNMTGSITAACASALGGGAGCASTVCRVGIGARNTYILDAYCDTDAVAYLTGQDCDGITVTYQVC